MGQPVATIGVWNVEWSRPGTDRGTHVARRLSAWDCDVLVVTEGEAGLLPAGGHLIDSEPDYGYQITEGRRKVLLWSRNRWDQVDQRVSDDLPSGRIVTGVTDSPAGQLRVVGVCVPWRDAHVRTGRVDRSQWEDHLQYLQILGPWLTGLSREHPLVVAGDFNQRIPAHGQPRRVAEALAGALGALHTHTAGLAHDGRNLIDHVVTDSRLRSRTVRPVGRESSTGRRLSDHDGLVAELEGVVEPPGKSS